MWLVGEDLFLVTIRLPEWNEHHIDDLVQDCSNPIANALGLLKPCTKPLICSTVLVKLRRSSQVFMFMIKVQYSAAITQLILSKILMIDTHSSPERARYGCIFSSSLIYFCSTAVIIVLYLILWYIVPCYNGNQLYHIAPISDAQPWEIWSQWLMLIPFHYLRMSISVA